MLNNWLQKVQGWAWPRSCLLCGDPVRGEPHFCPGCARALPWHGPHCQRCGNALPVSADTCGTCQQQHFAFDQVHACFDYRAPIDTLVQRLKYGGKLSLARALGETWSSRAAGDVDLLVPMPLHVSRLRERGFNQSLEIAHPLADRLDLRLAPDALARVRPTAPQAGLAPAQRARNVRDAFKANQEVRDLRIALVDDVMTTGQTAHAAAQALLRGGAKSVAVWVLARA